MKLLKDFLSRFQHLTPPADAIRKAVAHAVHDVSGVSVSPGDVVVQHGIAYVRSSSVAKSAIRISRGEILSRVFEHVPSAREALRDIR